MRRRGVRVVLVAALLLAGCTHGGGHAPRSSITDRSNDELAKFLPTLADYPWTGWNIVQRIGPPPKAQTPRQPMTVEPAGCDHPPYSEASQIAARTSALATSLGPTGFGGEASVAFLRDPPSHDLVADTRAWAKRCANYVEKYVPAEPGEVPGPAAPTSISILPDRHIEGVDVLAVHLTDNREHRFQPEGSRESVVYVARVRGIVVAGLRHDSGSVLDEVFGATIRRLKDDQPAPRPLSGTIGSASLKGRSDQELSELLPSIVDVPKGWSVGQTSPIVGARALDYQTEGSTDPKGCNAIPFMNEGAPRDDIGRDYREIATAAAVHDDTDSAVGGLDEWQSGTDRVRLHIEISSTDVIDQTKFWAHQCGNYRGLGAESDGSVELKSETVDGQDVYAVHLKRANPRNFDFWMLLARVRGVLVTAQSSSPQPSALLRTTIDHLRHAVFSGPASPVRQDRFNPEDDPPGTMPLPQPSAAASDELARVAEGMLVNPERYHFGGYLPGDAEVRSPDYLHFRSPTGSIACTWRRFSLYCDVPDGTYPRTPKPAGQHGDWRDTVVNFGWGRVVNGVFDDDPLVYAESNVLAYGSTIRLETDPDATECLMERDGLTCVTYTGRRIGMHLSREDLTPLPVTDALEKDNRAEPK
ncbi:hypothetical protein MAHJHV61_00650 [Mycobacterium avium subsp. hominissuis]